MWLFFSMTVLTDSGWSHCMHHTQLSPRLTSRIWSHFPCHWQGCPTSLMLFPCIFFLSEWCNFLKDVCIHLCLCGCLRQAWSMFNIILPRCIWCQSLSSLTLWLWASKGKYIYCMYVCIKKETSIRQLWAFLKNLLTSWGTVSSEIIVMRDKK